MTTTGQRKQFALGTALGEAFRYGFARIPRIFQITWPMYVAMIAIFAVHTVLFTLVWPVTQEELQTNSALFQRHIALNLAIAIAYGLTQVALFVVVARDYLLAEPNPWNWPAYGWTVLRSVGLMLLALLASVAITVPVFLAADFILVRLGIASASPLIAFLIGGFLVVMYLMTRVCTWAAASAVGRPQSLYESWQATRGTAAFKIMAGFLIQLLFFVTVFVVVIGGSGLLLYALDQIPSLPERPVTVGYVVAGLIQYVLGLIISAIGSVYLANVLKQTQAPG